MIKHCVFCGKDFQSKRSDAKYCSNRCAVSYYRLKKPPDSISFGFAITYFYDEQMLYDMWKQSKYLFKMFSKKDDKQSLKAAADLERMILDIENKINELGYTITDTGLQGKLL